MKLRNKQTGEIKEVIVGGYPVSGKTKMFECSEMDANEETGYKTLGTYTSLAGLNAEWEDYEEPKDINYWYIDDFGRIQFSSEVLDEVEGQPNNWMVRKLLGNYFSSREEAEKAVKKLKAWKRLRDKGISFEVKVIDSKWYLEPKADPQQRTFDESHDLFKDILFVFGGGE